MGDTETTLSFHRSLYAPEAVRAAVEAYSAYTESTSVEEGTHEVVVTLRGYDAGYGDAFADSFANHALFETVVRARQALGS